MLVSKYLVHLTAARLPPYGRSILNPCRVSSQDVSLSRVDGADCCTSTAGLADVCVRLAKFLKDANHGFRVVDQELEGLCEEIISLRSVNDLVERTYMEGSAARVSPHQQQIIGTNWRATQNTLASCQGIVERIEAIFLEVIGVGGGKHIKLDQLRRWLKQQSREEALTKLREKLKAHQIALQLSLSAVSM